MTRTAASARDAPVIMFFKNSLWPGASMMAYWRRGVRNGISVVSIVTFCFCSSVIPLDLPESLLVDLTLEARAFIPAAANQGENVARASMKMKWYCAATVLEALDALETKRTDVDLPLRFCVQDVYRFDGRRIIAGRIETGKLRVRG